MDYKCPGQDKRNIRVESISCPYCGYKIEIFSDESKVNCPCCKKLIIKDSAASCLNWCKFAEKCIGKEKWEKFKDILKK